MRTASHPALPVCTATFHSLLSILVRLETHTTNLKQSNNIIQWSQNFMYFSKHESVVMMLQYIHSVLPSVFTNPSSFTTTLHHLLLHHSLLYPSSFTTILFFIHYYLHHSLLPFIIHYYLSSFTSTFSIHYYPSSFTTAIHHSVLPFIIHYYTLHHHYYPSSFTTIPFIITTIPINPQYAQLHHHYYPSSFTTALHHSVQLFMSKCYITLSECAR